MVKADDVLLFVQVVENGSFSKVAELLQVTNSVVSKRIARLEASLNVQLLYRTTRKLSLTDAGRLLYGKGKIAKTAMQDATDIVSGYSSDMRGTIKITMPVLSANLILSKSVAEFCTLYPDIRVNLQVNNRVVDLIADGYDLAIRTADLEDSSLVARRLSDSKWIVCASPQYLKAHGTPKLPDDLLNHECLIYNYENGGNDVWMFTDYGKAHRVHAKGRFNTNNLQSICDAALAHFGIAFLPQALVYEHIRKGVLCPILQRYANKKMGIYAVYPKGKQPDQKVKLLIEFLRDAFLKQQNDFQ